MNEGTKKAIIILVCGILIGLLIGAAVLMFIHGDEIEKQEKEKQRRDNKTIVVPAVVVQPLK